MYSLSDDYKKVFAGYATQHVSIKVDFSNTANNSVNGIPIDESEIMQGTLTIDRSSMSGNTMEVGSAIAAELNFTLNNSDGHFSKYNFEGAELDVEVYVYDGDGTKISCPMGHFVIDTQPRRRSTIEISALDNMRKFDQIVNRDALTNSGLTSLWKLVQDCCNQCLGPDMFNSPSGEMANQNFIPLDFPDDEDMTYRELIQKACALMGVCAYADWDGKLCVGWYGSTSDKIEITKSDRYDGADIEENDITITGVSVTAPDGEGETYTYGNAGYMISVDDDKLLASLAIMDADSGEPMGEREYPDYQAVTDALGKAVKGTVYRPFSCAIKPAPYLWPMDKVVYTDPDGNDVETYVTHMTFRLNGHTDVEAEGDSQVNNTYYVATRTSVQSKILTEIENTNTRLTESVNALLHMNEAMMAGSGMFTTRVVDEETGATTYYFHDEELLEDSQVVFCFKSSGFMWTNNYKGDGKGADKDPNDPTVWEYGFTAEGQGAFHYLSVTGLTAKFVNADTVTANVQLGSTLTAATDSDGNTVYDSPQLLNTDNNGNVNIEFGTSSAYQSKFTVKDRYHSATTDLGRLLYDNALATGTKTFQVFWSYDPPTSSSSWTDYSVYVTTIKLGGFYLHSARFTTAINNDGWITYRGSATCIAAWWQGASPSSLDGYPLSNGQGAYLYSGTSYSSGGVNQGYPMWQVDADSARVGSRFYWIDTVA